MATPWNRRELFFGVTALAAALAACSNSKLGPSSDGAAPDRAAIADGGMNETGKESSPGQGGAGGTTGFGGAGASTGSGGAGGTAQNACGDRNSAPKMGVSTIGPPGGPPYDGPAIVERSTRNELVLAFTPPPSSGAADAGATSAQPFHVRITGLSSMASFPLGAKVWLSKSTTGDGRSTNPSGFGFAKWWMAVHDKKDGRLLLGAGDEPPVSLLTPLTFDNRKVTCSGTYSEYCGSGTATYSSVDVHGDTTVAVDDGETRMVRAGGIDYDVTIMSRDISITKSNGCADYFGPDQGFAADVRAKDVGSLAATLDVGPPIACARGNAELKQVGFSFFNVTSRTSYDGRVVYKDRRMFGDLECFSFTTELPDLGGTPAVMEFCATPGLLPQPTAGQMFWATTTSWRLAALKGPNRGPLLLAMTYLDSALTEPTSTQLESVLGIHLQPRTRCLYANNYVPNMPNSPLWELALGTASPVILETDGHALVPIATKSYDAWMWADGSTLGVSFAAQ